MCVIIDTNVAALVFRRQPDPDFAPVLDWISKPQRNGRVVYGGGLRDELNKRRETQRFLVDLSRRGRAILCPKEKVDAEERRVKAMRLCRSDDPHVIALARVSGARTLCSNNDHLFADFRNKKLIDRPRGSVYRNRSHVHLLRHTKSCGR